MSFIKKLNDQQRQVFQDKFCHYLRSYRRRRDLTQKDLAKIIGYDESRVRRFESSTPENRVISALEIINAFASLDGLSPGQFVQNLTDADGHTKNRLLKWQITLVQAFRRVDLRVRREFIHGFLNRSLKDKPKKLSQIIELAIEVEYLSEDDHKVLLDLASHLRKSRNDQVKEYDE